MDIDILLAIQSLRYALGSVFKSFFEQITFLAEGSTILPIMAVIYWCVSKDAGTYLLFGFHCNRLINGLLKITFCAYRPWIRDARITPPKAVKADATGYSFPSMHSTNAGSFYGGLALYEKKDTYLKVAGWLMVVLVMFSRLYFGVHTPQDVLVGAGSAVLMMLLIKKVIARMNADKNADITVLGICIAAAVLTTVYAYLKPYPVDYDEAGNILVEGSELAADTLKGAGLSCGCFIGLILERHFVRFSSDGSLSERLARFLFGMLGWYIVTILIKGAVKSVFSGSIDNMVNSFLKSFYIVFLYPAAVAFFQRRKPKHAPLVN